MYSRISNILVGSAMKGGRDFTLALLYLLSHSLSLVLPLSHSETLDKTFKHRGGLVKVLQNPQVNFATFQGEDERKNFE